MPNALEIAKYLVLRTPTQMNKRKLMIMLYFLHGYELLHYEKSSIPSLFYPKAQNNISHQELEQYLRDVSDGTILTRTHFPNIKVLKPSSETEDYNEIILNFGKKSLSDLQKLVGQDTAYLEAKNHTNYPNQVILALSIYKEMLQIETGFKKDVSLPDPSKKQQASLKIKNRQTLEHQLNKTKSKKKKKVKRN